MYFCMLDAFKFLAGFYQHVFLQFCYKILLLSNKVKFQVALLEKSLVSSERS